MTHLTASFPDKNSAATAYRSISDKPIPLALTVRGPSVLAISKVKLLTKMRRNNFIYPLLLLFTQICPNVSSAQKTAPVKDSTIIAENLGNFKNGFAEVTIHDRIYYLYQKRSQLLDELTNRSDGLTTCVRNGAYGVINRAGKVIVPFLYEAVNVIHETKSDNPEENYAFIIVKSEGKYGVVDTTGKKLIPPVYQDIEPLNSNLFKVEANGLWGWADLKTGKIIQKPIYDDVSRSYVVPHLLRLELNDTLALAKEDGVRLTPFKYNYLGVCGDDQQNFIRYGTGGNQSGLMTPQGKEVTAAIYDGIEKAPGKNLFIVKKAGKAGCIDRTGKVVLPIKFDKITRAGDFLILTMDKASGVMNKNGKIIIAVKNHFIKAINQQGQPIYIVKTGTNAKTSSNDKSQTFFVVNKDGADNSIKQYAVPTPVIKDVSKGDSQDNTRISEPIVKADQALFDRKGNRLTPYKYQQFQGFDTPDFPYLLVRKDNKYGLISYKGDEILPPVYDDIHQSKQNYACIYADKRNPERKHYVVVEKQNSIGLFDLKHKKLILPVLYQEIRWQNDALLTATNDNQQGLFNKKGEPLTKAEKYSTYTLVAPNRIVKTYQVDNHHIGELTDLKGKVLYKRTNWEYKPHRSSLQMPDREKSAHLNGFDGGLLKIAAPDKRNLFVDLQGKEKTFNGYTFVGPFFNHIALAEKKPVNGPSQLGFINQQGKEILPVIYDDIRRLKDSLLLLKKDGKTGLADINGEVLIDTRYTAIQKNYYLKDLLMVTDHQKQGVADRTGHFILPVTYQRITAGSDHIVTLLKNDLYGLADADMKILVPPAYEKIKLGYDHNFPARVKKGDWWYYLNRDGSLMNFKSKHAN